MADGILAERSHPTTTPGPARGRSFARTVAVVAAVAIAALAFGWPTRFGRFLSGDDERFVVGHVFVNHPSLEHAWRLLTMVHGDLYQPLPMLTFQVNYALAGADSAARFGIHPYGFHLTNIFLHALNAALACLIALRLARCPRADLHPPSTIRHPQSMALLVGLMFACHPLAVEPVAWISGRMILLATTFSLTLILICLCRREDGGGAWPWLGGTAWLLALLSKVLPTVPVAAAWCDRHVYRRLPRRCRITYAILLAAGAVAALSAVTLTGRFGLIERTEAETTTAAPVRVLLAGRHYLENYVWPSRVAAWSPPPQDVALLSTDTAVALLEWLVFAGLMWVARRRCRPAFIGLGLFLILIAPFLCATLARRILTADRYMYLPMLGLHLAVAATLLRVAGLLRDRTSPRIATGIVAGPCLVVLVVWMTVGRRTADCWADTVARDRRIVAVYPDRVEARIELARAHIFQREPDAALRVIAAARKRWPDPPRLASEAGEAYRLKQDWRHAAAELADAARRMPDRIRTQYYYGLTLEQLGQVKEARERYRRILERDDRFLPAVTALARSYRATGDLEAAAAMVERAIEINRFHRDSLFELALLEIRRQDWRRAADLLRSIIDLDPQDAPALLNLGVATTHLGHPDEALGLYDRLLDLDPAALAARINRAGLLASMGRVAEAEGEYRSILAEQPGHHAATVGLHELLQRQQRFADLVELWTDERNAARDPAGTQAYLTWAYALAGDGDGARKAFAAIPRTAPQRTFADWALAYEALRAGDLVSFRRLLGAPRRPHVVTAARREQARVILAAFSSLPEALRNSPAGLYALARAMLFDGDAASARVLALRIIEMPEAAAWSDAARQLADVLKTSTSRPSTDA